MKRQAASLPLGVDQGLTLVVLARVDSHGNDNDEAFDDILQVRVDADKVEAISDYHEDQGAKDDAWHSTYTAVKGKPTDDTSCNGIQLITFTGAVGSRADAGSFQGTSQTVKHTCKHVSEHQRFEDVDAGYSGGFDISANRVHVLAEAGFIPQHPDNDNDDHGVNNKVRDWQPKDVEGALCKL